MEQQRVHYERESRKIEFLDQQTECTICKSKLDIFVESVNPYQVKEEARCSACMGLMRVEDHILQ